MLYIFLMIVFLLCLGCTVSSTFAERSSVVDRPLMYRDKTFIRLITLFVIPTVITFIILMIMNWKITLIVFVPSLFLSGKILKPISEILIILPVFKFLYE